MSVRARVVILIALLALVFLPIARAYSNRYALTLTVAIGIYTSFTALLSLALVPTVFATRSRWMPFVCAMPYLFYAGGTGDFQPVALLKLLAVPCALLLIYLKPPERFSWQDFAATLLLIAVVLSGFLRGIWRTPVNLDFMARLYLIAVCAWTWTGVRYVPNLGYDWRIARRTCAQIPLNFIYFAAIAIPLSLALHFTRWNPRYRGVLSYGIDFLEIFLFIALLEELFFRGFLQSLLTQTWRDWRLSQLVVSLIFGLFHILHAPFPNWRYVALASIAGWFYGSTFRKTGSVFASAFVHAAVDTTWRTWFSAH